MKRGWLHELIGPLLLVACLIALPAVLVLATSNGWI